MSNLQRLQELKTNVLAQLLREHWRQALSEAWEAAAVRPEVAYNTWVMRILRSHLGTVTTMTAARQLQHYNIYTHITMGIYIYIYMFLHTYIWPLGSASRPLFVSASWPPLGEGPFLALHGPPLGRADLRRSCADLARITATKPSDDTMAGGAGGDAICPLFLQLVIHNYI